MSHAHADARSCLCRWLAQGIRLVTLLTVLGLFASVAVSEEKKADKKPKATKEQADGWISLFDGKSLKGWKKTDFGGDGKIEVKDGAIVLGVGGSMTGVTIDRKIPLINYEVEYEGKRVDGTDFFCGLTFPVGKEHCSLILGGWGGSVCGLSSLDGSDASENDTTTYETFTKGVWYKVRLRVTADKIEAWLKSDEKNKAGKTEPEKKIVDADLKNRRISTRIEVDASKPFGFSTWQTTGAIRNIRLRPIPAEKK